MSKKTVSPLENAEHRDRISSTKGKAAKQELIKDLKEWTQYPFMEHLKICGFKIPINANLHKLFGSKIIYAHELSVISQFGFAEGISAKVRTVLMDTDKDGVVSMEELEPNSNSSNDEIGALVDSFLSLFQNFGVIGALIISVLFPLLLGNSNISSNSQQFFGDTVVHIFYYIYLILINTVVVLSANVIFQAMTMYKHLGFWMPSSRAKLAWVRNTSVVGFVVKGQSLLVILTIAVPFGAASLGSPQAGLISAILVILFQINQLEQGLIEESALKELYDEVGKIVKDYES